MNIAGSGQYTSVLLEGGSIREYCWKGAIYVNVAGRGRYDTW